MNKRRAQGAFIFLVGWNFCINFNHQMRKNTPKFVPTLLITNLPEFHEMIIAHYKVCAKKVASIELNFMS